MKKDLNLKNNLHQVLALINCNSDLDFMNSTYNSFEDNGMEKHIGNGILDAEALMYNIDYSRLHLKPSYVAPGYILYEEDLYLSANESFTFSYSSLQDSTDGMMCGQTCLPIERRLYDKYTVELYNNDNVLLRSVTPEFSNYAILKYDITYTGLYTIKLKLHSNDPYDFYNEESILRKVATAMKIQDLNGDNQDVNYRIQPSGC